MPAPRAASSLEQGLQLAAAGDMEPLATWLARRGGLPGPRANVRLARAVAEELVQAGAPLRPVRAQMLAKDASVAPETTAEVFLPMVGVLALGVEASRASAAAERTQLVQQLHRHAEDPRRHVRHAVVLALQTVLLAHPEQGVEELAAWTDGYLHAEAALLALCQAEVLARLRSPKGVLGRLREAFSLASEANRAHQRSHGFRSLLRTLPTSIAIAGKRFPADVTQWLTMCATEQAPHMREVVDAAVADLRRVGLRQADVEGIAQALEASTPPPRDPRSYVGPTRARGRKARRRGKGNP
ncbi:MAG: hypothetical protein MUF54_04730 [Polyangiaceae bacterium]|jgi:hypothetical protein|nr:hypothetical protein [Polyangiaceae bacterium]